MNVAVQPSIEAEKGILGSILQDANVFDECAQQIGIEHFRVSAHRTIYEVIADQRSEGKPTDLISVTIALRNRNLLDSVGGAEYVTDLFTFVPTSANIQYYIDTVLEKHQSRQVTDLASNIIRLGKNGSGPAEMISLAENELARLHSDRARRIRFFSPSELRDFQPDNEVVLVGDCHIMRGEVFVIGGEPGIGKSRAATHLAVCGATERPWFGLTIRRRFKTMIVQTENGRYRLKQEFDTLAHEDLEGCLLVSEPPPFGLTLSNSQFQADIRGVLRTFNPDCVILDPWNAAAKDDKQRDYVETFDALRTLLPTGEDRPALGIVAHTKKPQQMSEKRIGGTFLQHLLAGSYILSSVPRCIFVMLPATEDETDDSVVFVNPKNNNGAKIGRSAWRRIGSTFTDISETFDWSEFEKAPSERMIVRIEHIREVFENGALDLQEAAHRLATLTGIKERSAYNALAPTGRFSANLKRAGGRLSFIEIL